MFIMPNLKIKGTKAICRQGFCKAIRKLSLWSDWRQFQSSILHILTIYLKVFGSFMKYSIGSYMNDTLVVTIQGWRPLTFHSQILDQKQQPLQLTCCCCLVDRAWYHAFDDDVDTVCYFFVLYVTKDDLKKKQYPVMDFVVSKQLAQSALENPNSWGTEFLGKNKPRPGLPFKNLRTLQAEL